MERAIEAGVRQVRSRFTSSPRHTIQVRRKSAIVAL